MESVFAQYESRAYPYRFSGRIHVDLLMGGTPTNRSVAEAWIKSRTSKSFGVVKDDLLAAEVDRVMQERGVEASEAVEAVAENRHLSGFRRDEQGLYLEGRCLKACLKEAVSVAANARDLPCEGWGNPTNRNYNKGIKAWFPEHVFVVEHRLHLGVHEPSEVKQSFVHARGISGIQYSEIVANAIFAFTIESDYDFSQQEWATIWLKAQRQGIGAGRSQGYGTFTVTEWEQIKQAKTVKKAA